MTSVWVFDDRPLSIEDVKDFVFARRSFSAIEVSESRRGRIERSHKNLYALLEKKVPVYGVTTGFGDSSSRFIAAADSEELQRNLVAYLTCGTGPTLPELASRATLLIRTNSLSRGYSGVSFELIERMMLHLRHGWTPVTPREGSLGASGDLIPLAYLAGTIEGAGMIHSPDGPVDVASQLKSLRLEPYRLKPKEGLALVNGTSSMAGLALLNLTNAHTILNLVTISTAWMAMALKGRTESFGALVNDHAQSHGGQSRVAKAIRTLHEKEDYKVEPIKSGPVQDRYSLRCTPQVLGPVLETIELGWRWLEEDINTVSDNPLIGEDGELGTGGNFYGGYLAHSQDYLKICIAHMADLMDRQLMLLMDDRQNRGLPPNLAAWDTLPESQRYLHHGLKALHQSVSAITSEIMAKAIPNSIFSRSSESHNQDKVSLGMSAAVQCYEMIEQMFNVQALVMACIAQGLDLRGVTLKDTTSKELYAAIRAVVPFVSRDTRLAGNISALSETWKKLAIAKGEKVLSL